MYDKVLAAKVLGITVEDIEKAERESNPPMNGPGFWYDDPYLGPVWNDGKFSYAASPSGRAMCWKPDVVDGVPQPWQQEE